MENIAIISDMKLGQKKGRATYTRVSDMYESKLVKMLQVVAINLKMAEAINPNRCT